MNLTETNVVIKTKNHSINESQVEEKTHAKNETTKKKIKG